MTSLRKLLFLVLLLGFPKTQTAIAPNLAVPGSSEMIATDPAAIYTDKDSNALTLEMGTTQRQLSPAILQTITVFQQSGGNQWLVGFQFDQESIAPLYSTCYDASIDNSTNVTLKPNEILNQIDVYTQNSATQVFIQKLVVTSNQMTYTFGADSVINGFTPDQQTYVILNELYSISLSMTPMTTSPDGCSVTSLLITEEDRRAVTDLTAPVISGLNGWVFLIQLERQSKSVNLSSIQSTRSNCGDIFYSSQTDIAPGQTGNINFDKCSIIQSGNVKKVNCDWSAFERNKGTYTVIVTAAFLNPSCAQTRDSAPATITYVNPCDSAVFDTSSQNISDWNILTKTPYKQNLTNWTITYQSNDQYNGADLTFFCAYYFEGAVIQEAYPGGLVFSEVTRYNGAGPSSGGLIRLQSNFVDVSVGAYVAQVKAKMNFTSVSAAIQFNVFVTRYQFTSCVVDVDTDKNINKIPSRYQQVDIRMYGTFSVYFIATFTPGNQGYSGYPTFAITSHNNPSYASDITKFPVNFPGQAQTGLPGNNLYYKITGLNTAGNNFLGSYNITMTNVQFNDSSNWPQTANFSIVVFDGCNQTQFTGSVEYTWSIMQQGDYNQSTPAWIHPNNASTIAGNTSYCGDTLFNGSISANSLGETIDFYLNTATSVPSFRPTKIGFYTVTAGAQLISYPSVTAISFYTMIVGPNCRTNTTINSQVFLDLYLKVQDPLTTFNQFSVYTNTAAQYVQYWDLFCGDYKFTISAAHASQTTTTQTGLVALNVNSTSFFLQTQAGFSTVLGQYLATLQVSLVDYPTVFINERFNIYVWDPCNVTQVTKDSQDILPTQTISTYAVTQTVAFNPFINTIAQANSNTTYCTSSYSYVKSITNNSNGVSLCSFDTTSTTTQFKFKACLVQEVGIYTVSLVGKLSQYSLSSPTYTFQIQVTNPCLTTQFVQQTLSDKSITVQQAQSTFNFLAFNNTVANQYSNSTFCGHYILSANVAGADGVTTSTSSSTGLTVFTLDQANLNLKFQAQLTTVLGSYVVTFRCVMSDYSNIYLEQSFNIIVTDPCTSTTFVSKTYSDINIPIQNSLTTYSFSSMQNTVANTKSNSSYCGTHTQTISLTGPNTTVATGFTTFTFNQATLQLSVQPSMSTQLGVYTVSVLADLVTYPAITLTQTYSITVFDPCNATAFVSQAFTNQAITVQSAQQTVNQFAEFTNTIANTNNNATYCGTNTYTATISGPNTTSSSGLTTFTFDYTNLNFKIQAGLSTKVGVYSVSLLIELVNYPTITLTKTFTITVTDPCLTTQLQGGTDLTTINMIATTTTATSVTFNPFSNTAAVLYSNSTYCLATTYQISISNSQNNTVMCQFTTSPTTRSFTLKTCDLTEVGSYTVTVLAILTQYPTISLTKTVSVIVADPCATTTLATTQTFPNLIKLIQDNENLIALTDITNSVALAKNNDTFCGAHTLSVQCVILASSTSLTTCQLNAANPQYSLSLGTTQSTTLGAYQVTLTATLVNYPSNSLGKTFTYSVRDYCNGTVLQSNSFSDTSTIAAASSPTVVLFTPFTNTVAVSQANSTYCRNVIYVKSITSASSNSITRFDTDQNYANFTIYAGQRSQKGSYTVSIYGYLEYYPTIRTNTQSFTLTVVDPCATTTIFPQTFSDLSLTVFDAPKLYSLFNTYTDSVSVTKSLSGFCNGFTYAGSISPTGVLTTFSLDQTALGFQIFSDQLSQAGVYTISLKITLNDYPSITLTQTIKLTVIDPCITATIAFQSPVQDMRTSILATNPDASQIVVSQTLSPIFDSVSILLNDGPSYICGKPVITISCVSATGTCLSTSELVFDSTQNIIRIYTSNNSTYGTQNFSINAMTDSKYQLTLQIYFLVQVDLCVLQALTYSPLNQTYLVTRPKKQWSYLSNAVTQFPNCGYKIAFNTQTSSSPYINVTYNSDSTALFFSVRTNNVTFCDNYTVSITAQPKYYPSSYNAISQTVISNVEISSRGLCYIAQYDTVKVSDVIQFTGYNLTTNITYNFTTDVETLVGNASFCGERTISFMLNDDPTQLTNYNNIKLVNGGKLTFIPPTTSQGLVQNISLTVGLEKYDSMTYTQTFNAVTLVWKPQTFSNISYLLGKPAITINYQNFITQLPEYCNQSTAVMYQVIDSSILKKYPLDQSKLLPLPDWLTNSVSTTPPFLQLSPDVRQVPGNYSIALVQFEPQFQNVFTYATFELQIINNETNYMTPYLISQPFNQKVVSCSPNYNSTWTYEIGKAADNNLNGKIALENVTISNSIVGYDPITRIISVLRDPQGDQVVQVRIQLLNNYNVTNQYSFSIQFKCPQASNTTTNGVQNSSSFDFQGLTKKISAVDRAKMYPPGYQPAQIESISDTGLVKVKFGTPVTIPYFNQKNLSAYNKTRLRILYEVNCTQIFNKTTLSMKMQQRQKSVDLNWKCVKYDSNGVLLQIDFENPLLVSVNSQDKLIVQFLVPDMILEKANNLTLFFQTSQELVQNWIPLQKSTSLAAVQASAVTTSAVTGATVTTVAVTVIVQIAAKKFMGLIWVFFCAMQLMLLINQHVNFQQPGSVQVFLKSVTGILNLDAIDKKQIVGYLQIPQDLLRPGGLLGELGGIALLFVVILLFIILLVVAIKLLRHPRVKGYLNYIWNSVFWNFLIRYDQGACLNFIYAALLSIENSGIKEQIISLGIILLQIAILIYQTIYFIRKSPYELDSQEMRSRIGNLYTHIDTRTKPKVLYGQLFFVQRIIIAIVMAWKYSYGIQFGVITLTLLMHALYQLYFHPYREQKDSFNDVINDVALLVIQTFQVGLSPMNVNPVTRYNFGLIFDGVICIVFLLNIGVVFYFVFEQWIYKMKLKMIVLQRYKARRAIILARIAKRQEIEQIREKAREQLRELQKQEKQLKKVDLEKVMQEPMVQQIDIQQLQYMTKQDVLDYLTINDPRYKAQHIQKKKISKDLSERKQQQLQIIEELREEEESQNKSEYSYYSEESDSQQKELAQPAWTPPPPDPKFAHLAIKNQTAVAVEKLPMYQQVQGVWKSTIFKLNSSLQAKTLVQESPTKTLPVEEENNYSFRGDYQTSNSNQKLTNAIDRNLTLKISDTLSLKEQEDQSQNQVEVVQSQVKKTKKSKKDAQIDAFKQREEQFLKNQQSKISLPKYGSDEHERDYEQWYFSLSPSARSKVEKPKSVVQQESAESVKTERRSIGKQKLVVQKQNGSSVLQGEESLGRFKDLDDLEDIE